VDWEKSQNPDYEQTTIEGVYNHYKEAVSVHSQCGHLVEEVAPAERAHLPDLSMRCFDQGPESALTYLCALPCNQHRVMVNAPQPGETSRFFQAWWIFQEVASRRGVTRNLDTLRRESLVPGLIRHIGEAYLSGNDRTPGEIAAVLEAALTMPPADVSLPSTLAPARASGVEHSPAASVNPITEARGVCLAGVCVSLRRTCM